MMDFSRVPPDKLPILMAKFFSKGPIALLRARPVTDLIAPVRKAIVGNSILYYHPTQLPIAPWADQRVMTESIDNFNFGDFLVEQTSTRFDLSALKVSPIFPQFGRALATEDIVKQIESQYPSDGSEIVAWMHESTAATAVLTAREAEYNVHSQVETADGDGNIPGVRTRSMAFVSTSSYNYQSYGATLRSPAGTMTLRPFTLSPVIGKDFLGWACASTPYGVQWHAALGEFIRLADTITQAVGFPNINGLVAPFFVLQQPKDRTERAKVTMVFNSDRDQKVKIAFRDPNNYTRVIDEGEISIPAGQSTVEFYVASYPSVPPVVNHMQPANGTRVSLNRFETKKS